MAGQWPCRGVGFNEIQGRTSGNPINLGSQRGFDKGRYTSSPWTGVPLHTEDVRTEPVGVVSRSILMVLLKAPGEHTTPPDDSLPCVCNDSQMCFGSVQRPQSEEKKKGRTDTGFSSWRCLTAATRVSPVEDNRVGKSVGGDKAARLRAMIRAPGGVPKHDPHPRSSLCNNDEHACFSMKGITFGRPADVS